MGAADRIGKAAIIETVDPIMAEKGIPSWLWKAIAAKESGFNPGSTANTSTEYSKGLFQINVKAHPQYIETNLYDPATNATIARDVFISPAWGVAQSVTSDPVQQALIVYSGMTNPEQALRGETAQYIKGGSGIRPKWTQATRDAFVGYVNEYRTGSASSSSTTAAAVAGGGISLNLGGSSGTGSTGSLYPDIAPVTGGGAIGMTPEGIAGIQAVKMEGKQAWVRFGLSVGVLLVIVIAGFLLVGNPAQMVLKTAKGE